MTTVILPHSHFDAQHLKGVKSTMQIIGSPTIRAFCGFDMIVAIEGSHRLRAAADLGVHVNFQMIDEDETIDLSSIDADTNGWFDDDIVPVSDFIAWWAKDGFSMGAETVEVE